MTDAVGSAPFVTLRRFRYLYSLARGHAILTENVNRHGKVRCVSILATGSWNLVTSTLYLATIFTATASLQAPPPTEAPRTTSEQVATFETSVAPRGDEDIAEPCKY